MLLAARGAFLAARRKPKLPYDAEVEYLESTGTQWIDTGLHSTTDRFCDFEIAFRKTTTSGQFYASPFGYQYGGTARYAMWGGTNNADTNLYVGVNASNRVETQIDTAWHLFKLRNGVAVELDGISTPIGQGTVRSNIGMALFATNRAYQGLENLALVAAQISMLKIWDTGGVLVRDFIPVRFTNGLGQSEGAMYDRANPTVGMNPDGSPRTDGLYRNRGTGAFLYGADKN